MAMIALVGMVCGLMAAAFLSPVFDATTVAIILPTAILLALTYAAARTKKSFSYLGENLPAQVFIFIVCTILALLFCPDTHWGRFGYPDYVRFIPESVSCAINAELSVLVSAPIMFCSQIFLHGRRSGVRAIDKFLFLPGFMTAMYLGTAAAIVLLGYHYLHHACMGFSGVEHLYVLKNAFRFVVAISTVPVSFASMCSAFFAFDAKRRCDNISFNSQ